LGPLTDIASFAKDVAVQREGLHTDYAAESDQAVDVPGQLFKAAILGWLRIMRHGGIGIGSDRLKWPQVVRAS